MVLPSAILLPLYIYPTSNTTWTPLYDAISEHPRVHFDVVVNLDQGPLPKSDNPAYLPAITQLRNYTNVDLYGYVHQNHGAALQAELETNITLWQSYDFRLDGIFIDEFPTEYNETNVLNLYSAADLARSIGMPKVIINPGSPVDTKYYSFVDSIVMRDGPWSSYNETEMAILSDYQRQHTSYLFNHFPDDDEKTQRTSVMNLMGNNYHSFLLTTSPDYTTFSPQWDALVRQVQDAIPV